VRAGWRCGQARLVKQGAGGGEGEAVEGIGLHDSSRARTVEHDGQLLGSSQIVPGASYQEPAMRTAVKRLVTQLDLRDVTLLGESMGAVLALTTAADLPDRVRRVVAVNPYDYPGGIAGPASLPDWSSQPSSHPRWARSSPGWNPNPSCAPS
jgi:pimeloyl-ACP methyl ester carboxylesterase